MIKKYANQTTGEITWLARKAIKWHRQGNNVEVLYFDDIHNLYHKVNIKGQHQNKKSELEENIEHCKRIAMDLDDYANGRVYKCPDCNEIITVTSDWSGEKYKCPNCETVLDYYDMDPQTLWDYFDSDIYDIEYRIGTGKEYRSVKVMVACGGPNIYIDTAAREVQLYWWTDKASYRIDRDTCEEVDNYFEELFECL